MKKQTNKFYVPRKPMYSIVVDKNYYVPLGQNKYDLTKVSYRKDQINLTGNDISYVSSGFNLYPTQTSGFITRNGEKRIRKFEFFRDAAHIHPSEELKTATKEDKVRFEKQQRKEKKKDAHKWEYRKWGHQHTVSGYRSPKYIQFRREMADVEYGSFIRAKHHNKYQDAIYWCETLRARRSTGWKEQGKKRHQWE